MACFRPKKLSTFHEEQDDKIYFWQTHPLRANTALQSLAAIFYCRYCSYHKVQTHVFLQAVC